MMKMLCGEVFCAEDFLAINKRIFNRRNHLEEKNSSRIKTLSCWGSFALKSELVGLRDKNFRGIF